jgi:hypothetical protein
MPREPYVSREDGDEHRRRQEQQARHHPAVSLGGSAIPSPQGRPDDQELEVDLQEPSGWEKTRERIKSQVMNVQSARHEAQK